MILVPFDYETTSNEPTTTRAVQVAAIAIRLDGSVEEIVNTYCNPEVDIHHEAAAVHGITSEMVADKPKDYEASAILVDWIARQTEPVIFGSYNGWTFDMPILRRMARMAGRPVAPLYAPHIDCMIFSQRHYPDAPKHSLSNQEPPGMIQYLGLGTGAGAHDAMADLLMVRALIDHFGTLLGRDWRGLAELCYKPHVLNRAHFGKHKGKRWGRAVPPAPKEEHVPYWYAKFCCDNFEEVTRDMQATMLHHYGLRYKKMKDQSFLEPCDGQTHLPYDEAIHG